MADETVTVTPPPVTSTVTVTRPPVTVTTTTTKAGSTSTVTSTTTDFSTVTSTTTDTGSTSTVTSTATQTDTSTTTLTSTAAGPTSTVISTTTAPPVTDTTTTTVVTTAAAVTTTLVSTAAPVTTTIVSTAPPVTTTIVSTAPPVTSTVVTTAPPVTTTLVSTAPPVTSTLVSTAPPVTSTFVSTAPPVTTTLVSTVPPVTSTLVQTSVVTTTKFQPTTITSIVATTITAPPATTAAANLVVDSTVHLTAPNTFQITGSVQPASDIVQIEFYDRVDGRAHDLGAASLNKDGTFTFSDHVAAGTQGFITAVATDAAGRTSTAAASFSLSTGPQDAPSGARQDRYDLATGTYTGSTVFYRDGSPKTVTSVGPHGAPLVTSHFTPDGFERTNVQAPGQTVVSADPGVIRNHGEPETDFVFDAGHGESRIRQFRADGSDHDTIELPAADFQSIADIINHTKRAAGGAEIHDPVTGDTVKVVNVSKLTLKNNEDDDFKFHG